MARGRLSAAQMEMLHEISEGRLLGPLSNKLLGLLSEEIEEGESAPETLDRILREWRALRE